MSDDYGKLRACEVNIEEEEKEAKDCCCHLIPLESISLRRECLNENYDDGAREIMLI